MEARRAGHGGLEARAALPRYACPNAKAAMSVPRQERKSGPAILTSVLPSTADNRQRDGHVRKVPHADSCTAAGAVAQAHQYLRHLCVLEGHMRLFLQDPKEEVNLKPYRPDEVEAPMRHNTGSATSVTSCRWGCARP